MSSATESRESEQPTREAGHDKPVIREIGHDEYDPVGTLALIALYFLILVLLWLFMYFVEFLGNDPTVVGWIGTGVGLA
ncbi:hypothetical protein [Natronobacterium texcoconense]|uniref:Ba3-type terminal oxidase subunit CbaD n=1 Tax=Natronobacterium texcoconense TaxID=1095778 RepID=A0A1H1HLI2_NATTX|nr:hypothetical protein [Natronobacterium texcoconense]SDR25896.1 hypothetical protein SAMN04489842_2832 [Natronobacterium texcoconense]